MLENGVHFVRVVVEGKVDCFDRTAQLERSSNLQDMIDAVRLDWYENNDDGEIYETSIDDALSVLQVQFSMADPRTIKALVEEIDPEDIAFNLSIGLPGEYGNFDRDICLGHGMKPPEKMYEMRPFMLSYKKLKYYIRQAMAHGHCSGLSLAELKKSMTALDEERLLLMQGARQFADYPNVPTRILSGAQMAADTRQKREDILMNVMFGDVPDMSARLTALNASKPRP